MLPVQPPKAARIAALSDLHFFRPQKGIKAFFGQFLSKRVVGQFFARTYRKKMQDTPQLEPLPELFAQAGVTHVLVCGDLTTTALDAEFAAAREYLDRFTALGMHVHVVPGNHDKYTRSEGQGKSFFKHFSAEHSRLPLSESWDALFLDTCRADFPLMARGRISKSDFSRLEKQLADTAKNKKILLVSHYPLERSYKILHSLSGRKRLMSLLHRHPQVQLYLHGHLHKYKEANLGFLAIDVGSVAASSKPSCLIADLDGASITRYPLVYNAKKLAWEPLKS